MRRLKRGDEIILAKGFGLPKTTEDKTLVVYGVDGFSALCTDGTILNSHDGNGVTKTGRKVRATPSVQVLKLLVRALLRQLTNWFDDWRQVITNKIWYLRWQLKHGFSKDED